MLKDKIISIQSRLIYGYVGCNIAELAIQLQGFDIISFPTVLLSAHSGHRPIYGESISGKLFEELICGIKAINVIESASGIISGYIRTKEIVEATEKFINDIKKSQPNTLYICDPVMGDRGCGLFIPEDIAKEIIGKLVPIADILTPNHYELEYILGQKVQTAEELKKLIEANELLRNKTVVITSCILEDSQQDFIETIVVQNGSVARMSSPKVSVDTVGTGDLFTATLSVQLAKGLGIIEAVKNATLYISKVLKYMHQNGHKEMNAACLLSARLI